MKKISILSILIFLVSIASNAADLSQKAQNMRSQLKSYLSSNGYSPSIDSDGDIKFTHDGGSFYVHFQDYKSEVAVSIYKMYTNDTDLSNATLKNICQEIMTEYIMAKVYMSSTCKTLYIEAEALYDTPAQVKDLFESNLMLVSIIADKFLERI